MDQIYTFYDTARAFANGESIWDMLDKAQTGWRSAVFEGLGSRRVLHVGASSRIDCAKTIEGWADATHHFVEPDAAGARCLESILQAPTLAEACERIMVRAVSPRLGSLVARRDAANIHRRTWSAPSECSEGPNVGEPVETISLDRLCAELRPDVIILESFGMVGEALMSASAQTFAEAPIFLFATAERSWYPAQWTDVITRLAAADYAIWDPTGEELTTAEHWAHSLSWYAIAVPRRPASARADTLRRMLNTAAEIFQRGLMGLKKMQIAAPAPFEGFCEIVALETAARASGADYLGREVEHSFFDINIRKTVARPVKLEAAKFAEADVLPGAVWKVCIGRRWYIEEIGYTAHGRLHPGVQSFPDYGGRVTVYEPSATLDLLNVPPGAILFGGDPAYYHFILNWLPRLRAIEMIDKLTSRVDRPHFIVSERLPERYFAYFDLILDRPYDLTRIPERGVWRFRDLIVPNFCSPNELHPWITTWYRERLGVPSKLGTRRLFLSRQDARAQSTPRRKVANEEEVMAALKQFGFERLLLEGVTPNLQIEIFRDAEFVIGPHGAAFANMQFTPAGAKALVLENEWAHTFMADMLTQAGHYADTLVCQDVIDSEYESAHIQNGVVDAEIRRSRDMLVNISALTNKLTATLC